MRISLELKGEGDVRVGFWTAAVLHLIAFRKSLANVPLPVAGVKVELLHLFFEAECKCQTRNLKPVDLNTLPSEQD